MGYVIALAVCIWLFNSIRIVDGRKARIIDGDSVKVEVRSLIGAVGTLECRLAGIDAPEWTQPQGPMAHRALERMMDQPRIVMITWKREHYGRALVRLYDRRGSINARMVREGFAFSTGVAGLVDMMAARLAKRGMWAHAPVIRPSEWRRGNQAPVRQSRGRSFDFTRLLDTSPPRFIRGFMPRRGR